MSQIQHTKEDVCETKRKREKKPRVILPLSYDSSCKYEIMLDEVGRGPLLGRVYVCAVVLHKILPKTIAEDARFYEIKDSKKFTSKKKRNDIAHFIQHTAALCWHAEYAESTRIDEVNILQAVMYCMHDCIRDILHQLSLLDPQLQPARDVLIVVDGNYFKPFMYYSETTGIQEQIKHVTIEQGDAKFMGIAAASIVAKELHDAHILQLCEENPWLKDRYDLHNNMGYGTKKHMDGIKQYGITQWHRKTFGKTIRDAVVTLSP